MLMIPLTRSFCNVAYLRPSNLSRLSPGAGRACIAVTRQRSVNSESRVAGPSRSRWIENWELEAPATVIRMPKPGTRFTWKIPREGHASSCPESYPAQQRRAFHIHRLYFDRFCRHDNAE